MSLPTLKLWRSGASRSSAARASRWHGHNRASPQPRRLQLEALEERRLLAVSPFQLADIVSGAGSSTPHNALAISPWVYFAASDTSGGSELWRTNGTPAGTARVADIRTGANGSDPQNLTVVGSTLYFTADDGANGRELWKFDGTSAPTMVKDIRSGATGSNPTNLTDVGGVLFFFANDGANGQELWKSDGSAAGTTMVEIRPGSLGCEPNYLVAMGGVAYFAANGGAGKGQELWRSNGTPGGTSLVLDIYGGGAASYPAYLTPVGSTLYFQADDGVRGPELWTSDGTPGGTTWVKDIYAGSEGSAPFQFAAIGSTVYFFADNGPAANGEELWKTDGTSGGTVLVKDINPGSGWSWGYYLTAAQDRLYFYADDGATGGELWTSDGTAAGTRIVQDARPGALGSEPWMLTPISNRVLYRANDGSHGDELWISNGDPVDTRMIADLRPDAASSTPDAITVLNNGVFWGGNDGTSGQEPWFLAANNAPTAIIVDPAAVMDSAELGTLVTTLSTIDPDVGDAHHYSLVAGAGSSDNSKFSITGNELRVVGPISYTSAPSLSIRIRSTDQALESVDRVVSISVLNNTLSPSYVNERELVGTRVGDFTTVNDPAGGPYTYAFATGVGAADNGKFTMSANTLKTGIVFDALVQQHAYVRVEVTDGSGYKFQKAFVVDIINIEDPPVAVDDVFSKTVDLPANVPAPGVLWNDYTPDPFKTVAVDTLVSPVSPPSHGSVTFNANGSFLYTPTVGYHGHDTFTYLDRDSVGSPSNVATVMINNLPVGVTDNYSVDEDPLAPLTKNAAQGVLSNDYDVDFAHDGDLITAQKLTDPAHGVLAYFNADGSFQYAPALNYFGPDSFTYAVKDPYSQVTVTVNITVNPIPDAPVAVNDSYDPGLADSVLHVPLHTTSPPLPPPPLDLHGLLYNDYDVDLEPLTAEKVTNPANGAVTVNADGSFVYTPNPGFEGIDSFIYRVTDPTGLSATAAATITCSPRVAGQATVVMPSSVWEGAGTVSQGGLLMISTPWRVDMVVHLHSDDPRLTVPAEVSIPAGATAVTFDFTVGDNSIVDPTNAPAVKITATPRGLTNGSTASTLVYDNEVTRFDIAYVSSPKTAGEYFPLTITAKNTSGATIPTYADPMHYQVTGKSGSNSVDVKPQGDNNVVFAGGAATLDVAVQQAASNVVLTVGLGANANQYTFTANSNPFDVQAGSLDHFVITGSGVAPIGARQKVGTAFPVTVTAANAYGLKTDTFNGTAALTGWVNGGSPPRVVISECSDGSPDYVEIQNVSGTTLTNLAGWKVVVNDASVGNVNAVTGTKWDLQPSMAPGQVLYRTDDAADNYFGDNIWWGVSTSKGWAMILDGAYKVVDFAAWGYTSSEIAQMAPVVDGRTISIGSSAWAGAGAAYAGSDVVSLQRFSDRDSNSAADFRWVARSKGTLNGFQAATYVNATPVPISPITTGSFTAGVWSGPVVVQRAATNMYLIANDGLGHVGQSNTFSTVKDTVGTYNPASSVFYLKYQNTGGYSDTAFGFGKPGAGWLPFTGDWDGDGKDTIGLYNPQTSYFYLRNSNTTGVADLTVGFGKPGAGWLPVVGDWDGDGKDTIGLYSPQTSYFYLRNSNSTGMANYAFGFGAGGAGWQPLSGNWDGIGGETVALYNSQASIFYLRNSFTTGPADITIPFGAANGTWRSIAGDWDGDGKDTVGVQNPATAVYYLTNSTAGGYAELSFPFGAAGGSWYPLAGDWLGPTGVPLLAADGPIDPAAKPLAADALVPVVEAALARWAELAVPQAALDAMRNTQFVIADLPGAQLGLAADRTVYIDRTAAGRGWFVDATPNDDAEFAAGATDAKAAVRADLLTAVAHELGHAAGLDHTSLSDDVMNELLPSGVRRTPKTRDLDALFSRLGAE